MLAQLNLDEYFLGDISVKTNPEFEKRDQTLGEIGISFDIKRKDMERHFMITMAISLNHAKKTFSKAPYQILLSITGFFSFSEGTDEETIHKLIGLNGLSILYGAARGAVAQVTANCRYGKFILPSVNFVELLKLKAKKSRTKKKRGD